MGAIQIIVALLFFKCLKAMLDAVELDGKLFFLSVANNLHMLQTLRLCMLSIAGHQEGLCFLEVEIKQICFTAILWRSKWLSMSLQCVFAGTCWHLRKLDWCEEVGEPLMDEVSVGRSSEPTGPESNRGHISRYLFLPQLSFV